jgi:hypothetical protein
VRTARLPGYEQTCLIVLPQTLTNTFLPQAYICTLQGVMSNSKLRIFGLLVLALCFPCHSIHLKCPWSDSVS